MKIEQTTPHRATLTELGRRLSLLRKQQRRTQAVLADEAGLGVATIIRMEKGEDAQLGSWIKVLAALGLNPALDTLLPEEILSPMAEVKKARRRRPRPDDTSKGWGDGKS
jgi:transcriptional regulator with XRE-family HTH domain